MPNTANYAERWEPELLEILTQDSLISPFITTAVKWLSAKTFHFTQMSTSGYKSHNRNGGWNRGVFVQTDVPFTVTHDYLPERRKRRMLLSQPDFLARLKLKHAEPGARTTRERLDPNFEFHGG